MKFKLDECLDVRLGPLFSDAGHNIQTVYQERLSGESTEYLIRMVILKIREEKPQGHLWIVGRYGIRIWPRD